MWINSKYINGSQVCRDLYGTDKPSARSKFSMKKRGFKNLSFSTSELEKLEEIRKEVEKEVKS
jgi:hypothetical protein